MAYSTTFDNLDSLLRSLSSNSASSPYEINITDILPANLKGNQTATSGTMQYVLQQNPTKYVSLNIPQFLSIDVYSYMFYNCPTLVKLDMTEVGYQGGNVNWVNTFKNCTNLKSVNLSFNENYASVMEAVGMFYGCSNLKSADLHGWKPASNQYTNEMFYGCSKLEKLFNVKLTSMGYNMFYGISRDIDFYCSSYVTAIGLAMYSHDFASEIYGSTSTRGRHTFYDIGGCEFLPSSVSKDSSTGVITVNHADVEDMINYNISHNNELGLTTSTSVSGNCKIHETNITGSEWIISSAWNDTNVVYVKDIDPFTAFNSPTYMSPDYSYTTMPSTVNQEINVSASRIYKLPSIGSATILDASNCSYLVDYPATSPFLQTIKMLNCPSLPEEIEINIPSLVTATAAFNNCRQIKKVKITGCTTINNMFDGCTNLEEVEFSEGNSTPSNLSSIFSSCTNLKTVRMPFSIPAANSNAFPSALSSTVKLFFTEQTYASDSAKAICGYNIFSTRKSDVKCYFCPDAIDDVTEPESLSIDSSGVISIDQDEIGDLALWNDWNGDTLNLNGTTATSPVKINEKNITGMSWTNDFLNIQSTADYGYYISDSTSSPTLIMAPDASRYSAMFVDFSSTVLPSNIVTINDDNDTHITATPVPAPSPTVINSYSFKNCTALKDISCNASETYKIASMTHAFKGCTSLESWNASQSPLVAITTNGSEMFRGCTALETVDMPERITNASRMFQGCTALESIDLKNKSDITDASYMFSGCTALENIHNFDIPKTVTLTNIFQNCSSLANVYKKSPAAGTNTGWQLIKAYTVSGGLAIKIYSGIDKVNETLVLLGTATLQGLNKVQMLGLTDEILFSDNVTDQNLYDLLLNQYQFGLPGEGLPNTKDCFTMWAEDPSLFYSNIDFSSQRLEYSSGTGLCKTVASLAEKKVDILNYTLTSGSSFVVTFTNANSYSGTLTLNVNNTGAKSLYINGTVSSSTNHTLPAGSYNVTYDGSYYYIETSHSVASARITSGLTSAAETSLLQKIYPVGSIYMNAVNNTNPGTLLGFGSWDPIGEGRVLLGAGANKANNTSAYGDLGANTINRPVGEMGGEVKHSLEITEMPKHTHIMGNTTTVDGSANKTLTGSWNDVVTDTVSGRATEGCASYQQASRDRDWTGRSGDATLKLYFDVRHKHEIGYTGGAPSTPAQERPGDAHNNMMPYLVVYMWKRRA